MTIRSLRQQTDVDWFLVELDRYSIVEEADVGLDSNSNSFAFIGHDSALSRALVRIFHATNIDTDRLAYSLECNSQFWEVLKI